MSNTQKHLSDEEKINKIEPHIAEMMNILGLDLEDPSLKNTPHRVAKMYVTELFKGLNDENAPKITVFPNDEGYDQMLIEKDIRLHTVCEHHLVPIVGVVHIAYIPKDTVIGLSKFHRIVDFLASKPAVQERLTQDIGNTLIEQLGTEDVAVVIDAVHFCCHIRGVKDPKSSTITSYVSGVFRSDKSIKDEFLSMIR